MADIKLVIKIPEEIYRASQIIDVAYEDVIQIPLEVIANGIPLPKGHGRLKDVDHYIKMQWENPDYGLIDDEPTIIEADKAESEDKE